MTSRLTEIEAVLDDVLQSSLWQRRLLRYDEEAQQVLTGGLLSRSKLIWGQSSAAQRRGYFLAGVGLTAGQALDAVAAESNLLLVNANAALLTGDADAAINAITSLAERVLTASIRLLQILCRTTGGIYCAFGFLANRLRHLLPDKNRKRSISSRAVLYIGCLGPWKPCVCGRRQTETSSAKMTWCSTNTSLDFQCLPSKLAP